MSSQEFYDRIEFPWADHGESPEQVISKLQQQLAAERERYASLEKSILDLSHPNCKDLLQQLDAERDKYAALTGSSDEVIEIDEEGKITQPKPI